MSKYKIGDLVYAFQDRWDIDDWYTEVFKDNPGQIKYINSDGEYAIEFERPYKYFYDCGGYCIDKHGWWIWGEEDLIYAYTLSDKIEFIRKLL